MTALIEKGKPVRLEDFIALAGGGKDIDVEIELGKQSIKQKAHPGATEERRDEVDAYLLMGDYTFKVEGDSWKVSKVYMMGFAEESLDVARLNKSIANDRLKMDYKRLQGPNVGLEPKYF
jgi:hypothetical protein